VLISAELYENAAWTVGDLGDCGVYVRLIAHDGLAALVVAPGR
jgi:hypothetical protein